MKASVLLAHVSFATTIFCLSAGVTYFMSRVVRVMDIPTERSSHARPVPKSGGLAIVVAFIVGSLVIYFLARHARIEDRYFCSFLRCGVLLALVSFLDDITQASFQLTLFTQLICILII